jgi:hypothetical protein
VGFVIEEETRRSPIKIRKLGNWKCNGVVAMVEQFLVCLMWGVEFNVWTEVADSRMLIMATLC